MSRNVFYLFFITIILTGCSENFKYYTKVINNLNTKYNFNRIEADWDDVSVTFYFVDVKHDDLSINEMQSLAIKINKYIINQYPKIDSLEMKHYIFSGIGGFEIVQFTLNRNGDVIDKEEY